LAAGLAHVAGRGGGRVDARERLGQDACGGGLADAARAPEQERVVDPPARDRILQRARHVLLADDAVEPLRPILPGQDEIGHRGGLEKKRWLRAPAPPTTVAPFRAWRGSSALRRPEPHELYFGTAKGQRRKCWRRERDSNPRYLSV